MGILPESIDGREPRGEAGRWRVMEGKENFSRLQHPGHVIGRGCRQIIPDQLLREGNGPWEHI